MESNLVGDVSIESQQELSSSVTPGVRSHTGEDAGPTFFAKPKIYHLTIIPEVGLIQVGVVYVEDPGLAEDDVDGAESTGGNAS